MSAYIKLATPMIDHECLLDALADLGFGQGKLEIREETTTLEETRENQIQRPAEIIIRRQYLENASRDFKFQHSSTGYQAVVYDYDLSRFGKNWLRQLNELYQHHNRQKQERLAEEERQRLEEERQRLIETQRQTIHEKARKMGYRVKESRQGDKLRLVLVKRVY
ncbi:MAG: hypothetical protein EP343_34710 [Deltaproteobacteria bacterium]|nr:MAG: hypothetical protein EP343_34710 [Deltaproteobacteria bacterium]